MAIKGLVTAEQLRNKARKLFWGAPRAIMPILIQLRFQKKFVNRIKIEHTSDMLKLIELSASGEVKASINFYHPLRSTRYFDGIDSRIEKLVDEYCLNQIDDLTSGVFIDIGSNIGEFSLGIAKRFPNSQFIRFEPSSEECKASLENLKELNDHLIPKALWKEKAILNFYNRNDEGDSSLFSPDDEAGRTTVETSTLDIEMEKFDIETVQLLKLEAEGAEPEILLGGNATLKKCRYVAADLGPERGTNQEETFEEANGILLEYGFTLIGRNLGSRKCFLYKNSAF